MNLLAALRRQVRSCRERQQRCVLSTAGVLVVVDQPPPGCRICGGSVGVQKTLVRHGATLEHGAFRVRETVYACCAGCRSPGRVHAIHRAPELATRIPPRHTVGYDVMVYVGLGRYIHHRQREELRSALQDDYGIVLSTGEISELGRKFLTYLERLHHARAHRLRTALKADGGWPLHVDATGENGRGTLFVAFAGWRRWVLGSWKIPTERADAILPRLRSVTQEFGPPCAIVRDLGRAVTEATRDLVEHLGTPVPILACHQHFLSDIGGDLLGEGHDRLRDLLRRHKVRPGLAALARDLGRRLGSDLAEGRAGLHRWQGEADVRHGVPDGASGLACVRAMAQWVLDFAADGQDQGFPFDRPYLDLCARGRQVRRAIDAFLRRPLASEEVARALRRLGRVLDPLVHEPGFAETARSLRMRAALFDRLRDALRLTPKPDGRNSTPSASVAGAEEAKELGDIRTAVADYRTWVRSTRPERGPAKDRREATDIILRHFEDHGKFLWGHVIRLFGRAGRCIRLVDRTNNIEEGFFHKLKHGERRRSGRKTLTQDLEQLPAAAALAANLTCRDYVEIACGSLDRLPDAFAALDAKTRGRARSSVGPAPALSSEIRPEDLVSASLPASDRQLVRAPAMEARILAAANSRAPVITVALA